MAEILRVDLLSKSYGNAKVLDNFNFRMKKGEVIGILGENGAGKSTAIECMLGIQRYDTGLIRFFGLDLQANKKNIYQRIGVQFQNSHYQDKIRVNELCEITACLYDKPMDWKILLEDFNLDNLQKAYTSNLSSGECQRLSIVLALIPNPDIVFLDELTTALDTRNRNEVIKYILKLKESGLSIILVSHFMDEVILLCDEVYILKKGITVINGSIQHIIKESGKDNFEEAYLYFS